MIQDMERETRIYSSGLVVAAAFAQFVMEEVEKVHTLNIAISGGSTPKLLFSILSEVYGNKIDWSKIHIYWVDERCVPPADEQSNYRMTHANLLNSIAIPPENVHRIYGEDDPTQEVLRYSNIIRQILPIENGIPVFDIMLLGMGDDGHTASIFPPELHLLESQNICAVGIHPSSGQKRITLTGTIINCARQKHFLVSGANKKDVVSEIFNNSKEAINYPAAYIKDAIWWFDKAAAAKL
ncbi:MAG: 6-phosphogluconolactonase [Saprospiraceae bacterium]|jgi:6-phosphogluconolactonase